MNTNVNPPAAIEAQESYVVSEGKKRGSTREVRDEAAYDRFYTVLRVHPGDALVLDCSVYNMSESLFDSVRENPDQAEFPVIIISDTPEEADASLRSRNAQKVMLIPKPFTGAHVARALDELLK